MQILLDSLSDWDEAQPATAIDVLRCHEASYVDRLRGLGEPTWLDLDTFASGTTWEAALLAAGTTIAAARRGAFAVVRPPGHHALRDRAMGFCILNNIAIAARALQADGVERIAIVDFDVHHGNGTEAIFADDDSVLYASLHEWPLYPGTGGDGDQATTTVNVPLSPGSGDDDYLRAFDDVVAPAVSRFEPDAVLVSAGFDAHVDDPLAHMHVTEDGFRELARRCVRLGPQVAAVLEGGYNLETLPRLLDAARDGFSS